jgi:hypothetical protein
LRHVFRFTINLADALTTGALILNYDIVEEPKKRDAEAEADASNEEAGYTGAGGKLPH